MNTDGDDDKRNETNLPARAGDGFSGFDDDDDGGGGGAVASGDRVIQGEILKCTDGVWASRDGLPPPKRPLLVLATATVLQLWQEERPVETIVKRPGEPLPDVDALNAKIPMKEWEEGLDGKPRPPWQKQWLVYFLNEETCEKFTFASGTIGARIAVDILRDSVVWMRKLKGQAVYPVVELANKPMKTRFGQKLRPDLKIVGWRGFDDGGETPKRIAPPAPAGSATVIPPEEPAPKKKRGGITTVAKPPLREQLDDDIRY
jgi:hypothetical protein